MNASPVTDVGVSTWSTQVTFCSSTGPGVAAGASPGMAARASPQTTETIRVRCRIEALPTNVGKDLLSVLTTAVDHCQPSNGGQLRIAALHVRPELPPTT